jgi:putative addiction module component (TIGR02574 family)
LGTASVNWGRSFCSLDSFEDSTTRGTPSAKRARIHHSEEVFGDFRLLMSINSWPSRPTEGSSGAWQERARIEVPGAVHHVRSRGNNRQAIFLDDGDPSHFLALLDEAVRHRGWLVMLAPAHLTSLGPTSHSLRGTIFRMARKLHELFREAAELSESERAELAGLLLESLEGIPDEDVEAAWAEEVERRVRQIDSGEVKTIPWEQVRAELYTRLNDKR